MTRDQAIKTTHGQNLYHTTLKDSQGKAVRCRVNGVCKIWKRNPDAFRLPVKHGLYDCFYITPQNANEWTAYRQMSTTTAPALMTA